MIPHQLTDNSLTVWVLENGRVQILTVTSTHSKWKEILVALKNDNTTEIVNLISVKNVVENYTESNVTIEDGNVFYRNKPLHGLDVDRLLQFAQEGIPFLPLARFLEKKQANPSYRAIKELYKFLEHKKMPLTPNGTILGYKGINNDFYSVHGNTNTIVISGQTDSAGRILNTVGSEIRCERSCVCDDYKQGCSSGLHIGSLEYALSWGQRVVIVEFNPADVVSVPDDCNCQKLRVCAYKVVGEYTKAMPDTYTEKYEANDGTAKDDGTENSNNDCGSLCNCKSDTTENDEDTTDTTTDDDTENNNLDDQDVPDDYSIGYELGLKEGKAHKARKYLITDEDSSPTSENISEIEGYNDGYRRGRYGKTKYYANGNF